MRSNRSSVLIIWLVICMMSLGNYGVFAGSLDAPGGPESPLSAMYSLESVYNRLDTGEAGSKRTGGFTEPSAGPVPTRHNLNEIMDKAPTVDAVNGATNTEVLAGQTYWGLQSGAWGTQTGTLATVTLSADNDTVSAGNYVATTLSAVDTDLATNNIKSGVTIFGFEGSPNVVDTTAGTAGAGDMLLGKVAYVGGAQVVGNVAAGSSLSGTDGELIIDITDGLYSGSDKTATASDTNLVAVKIAAGEEIFGVTGSALVSTGDAVAGDVLTGHTFSHVSAVGVSGTMPNQATRGYMPATTNLPIEAGYYDGTGVVTGDASLVTGNIKAGTTIFGVSGDANVVDTTAGTAGAGDMLLGKVAYVGGAQVVGNVAAGNNVSGADGSKTFTITDGLYSGNKTATAIDTDLTAGNIKDSVTIFGVTGTFTGGGGTPTNAYVGKTGQTTSYRTGDDGDLEEGIAWPSPRFTDLGNRIRDNLTGLEWTENANLAGGTKSWDDAVEYCNSLTVDTLTDWRLPNRFELESLLDLANVGPALPSGHPFDNVQNIYYWSSTAYADYPPYAWYVYMRYGHVDAGSRGDSYYVWPVRGGQ